MAVDKKTMTFEILRDKDEVIGFSLVALGQTEAEAFCHSFPAAVGGGRATVRVCGTEIIFKHEGWHPAGETDDVFMFSEPGEFVAEVPDAGDRIALRLLLDLKGQYTGRTLRCAKRQAWEHGFELRAVK